MSEELTRNDADRLLRENIRNIRAKVFAGRILSAGEIAILTSLKESGRPDPRTYAKSQDELAEVLGISRKTISRAMKRPGCPGAEANGSYNIAAWRAFLADGGATSGHSTKELRDQKLLLENELLALELAAEKRQYVKASDVERWGQEMGTAIRKILTKFPPAVGAIVGLPFHEAEDRAREIVEEILEQLSTLPERMGGEDHEPAG